MGVFTLLADDGPREWTSKVGTKVEAELVKIDGEEVILKLKSGKELRVKTGSLSDEDQVYLKSIDPFSGVKEEPELPSSPKEEKMDKDDVKEAPKGKKELDADEPDAIEKALPVFADGENKGLHAIYDGKFYVARVNAGGGMSVYPKVDGKEQKDWGVNILCDVLLDGGAGRKKFWFTKFLEHDEAAVNPEKVRFYGERSGGILCEVIYEFGPDYVTTWFRAVPGADSPQGLGYRMRHLVGGLQKVDKSKKFAKACKVKQKLVTGDRRRLDFEEAVSFRGDSDTIEISGPIMGKGRMIFEKGKGEASSMGPYQYPKTPLQHGFAVYMTKSDPGSKDHENEKMTIRFK